jgi:hypothetical protein
VSGDEGENRRRVYSEVKIGRNVIVRNPLQPRAQTTILPRRTNPQVVALAGGLTVDC